MFKYIYYIYILFIIYKYSGHTHTYITKMSVIIEVGIGRRSWGSYNMLGSLRRTLRRDRFIVNVEKGLEFRQVEETGWPKKGWKQKYKYINSTSRNHLGTSQNNF